MKSKRIAAAALALILICSLALTGCGKKASVKDLVVTYVTSPLNVPSIVEKNHGIFAETILLVIKHRNILQRKPFTVENVVHCAENLHDTFQRHSDDTFHTNDKIIGIRRGNIQLKCQFPQFLIGVARLAGRTDNDLMGA